jgi:hypothetical protein
MTEPAAPCVVCQSTGGAMQANTHRPARISLAPYGLPGVACHACYYTVRYRATHGLDPVSGRRLVPRKPVPTAGEILARKVRDLTGND